jgi:hypothetical protein
MTAVSHSTQAPGLKAPYPCHDLGCHVASYGVRHTKLAVLASVLAQFATAAPAFVAHHAFTPLFPDLTSRSIG